ncbi:pleckstrin-2-like [Saccoglossus kowalevskii]|uniref:Pleckstrin-2-like n=1 Tax=Saccoglossus kowalevskii TaxID=10224 RepID=A0ABM0MMH9_SACKO|nr:PREDICTED: pleckstrin-2-like [Saccoglossus kowalevskii]
MVDKEIKQTPFKEGFLVKKGHVRTNWRTRWFVIGDVTLSYYRRRGDPLAADIVLLKGCSVISPCPEYNKKPGVFRVLTKGKKEYLIQASSEDERDDWVKAIGEAIRRSETKSQNRSDGEQTQQSQPPSVSHSELVGAMQDPDAGLPLISVTINGKEYKNCFTGEGILEWLVSWSFVTHPDEAGTLGNSLLQDGHIQYVSGIKDGFNCSADTVYRFSTLKLCPSGKSLVDSSSDDDSDEEGPAQRRESSSDADAVKGYKPKGKFVKQGFLVKRGHVRHTWKTRLFILRKDPHHMIYYKGSKQDEMPLGEIPLTAGFKVELESAGTKTSDVKNKSRTNLFKVVTRKGDVYILQANNEEERDEWLKAIQTPDAYST